MTKKYYSNGKLLLTGEYGVLDGALSLAVPTKFGQSLIVSKNNSSTTHWQSFNENNEVWFESTFDIEKQSIINCTDNAIAETLIKIIKEAKKLNPNFIALNTGYIIKTELDFARNWGLGTSSTLINNIAQWANIDPYTLLWNSFSGSGYDIACAKYNSPILYQVIDKKPVVNTIAFNPPFKENIFFVHLNKKQNSRDGIAAYRKAEFDKGNFIESLTAITQELCVCIDLEQFKKLVLKHEAIVGEALNQITIKQRLFADYEGEIKSLGAWGGDFIMAVGPLSTPVYFEKKGFKTVIPYSDMVL